MSSFKRFKSLDPVIFRSFIFAVFAVLSGLGLSAATSNKASVLAGLLTGILALVQGGVTKPAVTPNSKVLAYMTDPFKPHTTQILSGEATVLPGRASVAVSALIKDNSTQDTQDLKSDHDI